MRKTESSGEGNVRENDEVCHEKAPDKGRDAGVTCKRSAEDKQALESELVGTDSQASLREISQLLASMEGEEATNGNASESRPGQASLETAGDEAIGKAGTAESVQSNAEVSGNSRDCNMVS